MFVSTDPLGGAGTWKTVPVNISQSANDAPGYGPGPNLLDGASCPTTSLCVAVDTAGEVVTSTDPIDPSSSAWRVSGPLESSCGPDYGNDQCPVGRLNGIASPSASLCVAVAGGGLALVSTDPAGGASTFHVEQIETTRTYCAVREGSAPCTAPLDAISCPSTSFCVAADTAGDVVSSTNPSGGASTWTTTKIDSHELTAVSCASVYLCVAGDGDGTNGNVLSGTADGVSRAAAAGALQPAARACSGSRIARVLRRNGCAAPCSAPGRGGVSVTWLGPHRVRVASGETTVSVAAGGRVIVRVRLSRAGRRLLGRARRSLRLRVEGTFRDLPGHLYTSTAQIWLRR